MTENELDDSVKIAENHYQDFELISQSRIALAKMSKMNSEMTEK